MRLALTFLLGMLLGACTAGRPTAPAQSQMSDHVSGAAALEGVTVALLLEGTMCTGVWVSERSILTANHCVHEGVPVVYATHADLFPNGGLEADTDVPARIAILADVDEAHDLALLYALKRPAPHDVARLHEGPVSQGSFAQSMGHPRGYWYSYTTGEVSAVRERGTSATAKVCGCSRPQLSARATRAADYSTQTRASSVSPMRSSRVQRPSISSCTCST